MDIKKPSTKKILVHMCCGPCSIYPLKEVLKERAEVWGYFHNPNIHPRAEFNKRLNAAKKLASLMGLKVIYDESYTPRAFIKGIKSAGEGSRAYGERCLYCYSTRLEAVAKKASELGFDAYTSSLLYSRYQDHEDIKRAGREFAEKYNVEFFYEDFRRGWIEGIEESRRLELYRQKYCGCIYSKVERAEEKRASKEEKRLKREAREREELERKKLKRQA